MSAELIPPAVNPGPTAAQQNLQIALSAASCVAAWLGLTIVVYLHFLRKKH